MRPLRPLLRHLAIFWFVVPFAIVGAIDAPVQAQTGQDEVGLWAQRLDHSHDALSDAESRYARAQAAYMDWRQRKRPRGDAKAELLTELEAARVALERQQSRFPELLEQARRAGVPAGILRSYE